MNNYNHETPCPYNKGIRKYLWYDYFHDSKVYNVFFDHTKGIVELTLECIRDIDEVWKKLKCDRETRSNYIDKNMDDFTYVLTFKGTQYFHTERLVMVNDYLNGRFKDTALLKKLSAESKKPLYHFRIQIDDGYMDIIFSDFKIRKKSGRVNLAVDDIRAESGISLSNDDKKEALDGDDFQRFLAMSKLYRANYPDLLEIARANLHFDKDGDSCLYAAYLLGKLGDISDIPKIMELYLNFEKYMIEKSICRCGTLLPKRNLLDAIELGRVL